MLLTDLKNLLIDTRAVRNDRHILNTCAAERRLFNLIALLRMIAIMS